MTVAMNMMYSFGWLVVNARLAEQISDRVTRSRPGNDLVVIQSRQAVEPRVLSGVADVDHQDCFERRANKELLIDAGPVKAEHRASRQPHRSHGQDEVTGLKRGVEPGRGVAHRLIGEGVFELGTLGKQLRNVFVEVE